MVSLPPDPLRRAFYRHSARRADWILTDSEFSKGEICASYDLDPGLVAVVPLAAAAAFTPGPRLPLPAGVSPPFVLHVGDLHPRRNLVMLARAVQRLRRSDRLSELSLVLVGVDRGSGTELRSLNVLAGGRRDLIQFVVAASEPTLLALYRSAAALVYPSRYEGFGLPLLEAMACGTPVIAAATSSIPEVVGSAAVLLDPDDQDGWTTQIATLIEDGPQAGRFARGWHAARSRVLVAANGRRDRASLSPRAGGAAPVTPEISVIVLNHNGRRWLAGCLDAVAAQSGAPAFEVIFVDNASSDGSAEFVSAHYPSVIVSAAP